MKKISFLLLRDEKRVKINIPLILLPSGSREGDILDIPAARDEKEAEAAKARVFSFFESLKARVSHDEGHGREMKGESAQTHKRIGEASLPGLFLGNSTLELKKFRFHRNVVEPI